jgi:hypothetical protein
VTLALEGEAGISRGLPPLIPAHKKNNAKLPYQASYWQWGQIGTTPDCTYLSTMPSSHITPLDNTKAELIRGTAYFNKDTCYMLHISPSDTDKFFDAQETLSFSSRAYDDTQEEAFFVKPSAWTLNEKKKLITHECSRAIAWRTNCILCKAMGYTTKVLYKDEVGTIKEAKKQAEQDNSTIIRSSSGQWSISTPLISLSVD